MTVVRGGVFDRYRMSHVVNLFDVDQKYGSVTPIADVLVAIATRTE